MIGMWDAVLVLVIAWQCLQSSWEVEGLEDLVSDDESNIASTARKRGVDRGFSTLSLSKKRDRYP